MKKSCKDRYAKTLREIREFEVRMRTRYRELLSKHGILALRLSDILNEVNLGIHDEAVCSSLKRAIETPLEKLFEMLETLDRDSQELDEKKRSDEEHKKYADLIAKNTEKFDNKFLEAFAGLIIKIHSLRENEEEAINLLEWACAEIKKAVRDCVRVHEKLKEALHPLSSVVSEIERSLLHSKPKGEELAAQVDNLRAGSKSFYDLFRSFQEAESRYDDALKQRDDMYQDVNEFDRMEAVLSAKLETAEEWAEEMGLNPFLAIGEEKKRISRENSKIADCRAILRVELPSPPAVQSAEKMLEIVRDLEGRLEELRSQDQKRIGSTPKFSVLEGKPEEKKVEVPPKETAFKIEVTAPMKLSPKQFAVCVFGAFCTERTHLGRTAEIVYRDFLQANGLTFGYSLEDFRRGLIEARDDNLMLHREVGRGKRMNDVWKPSDRGFEKAGAWLDQLPVPKKDFVALMRYVHQSKKQASKTIAKERSKKTESS